MSGMPDRIVSAWATRLRRPRWTDPRLLVGLVLVAVATVAGARLLAGADDTAAVWATADEVRAGDPVRTDDLVATPVHIEGLSTSPYLVAGESPPTGVFTHDLAAGELVAGTGVAAAVSAAGAELSLAVETGDAPADLAAGELVPVSAVGAEPGSGGAELSLSVALGDAPADLATGDLVDVWAVPDEAVPGAADAQRVLAALPVLAVAEPSAALGGTERQVLLRLDDSGDALADPLGRLAGGSVVLVRVGR